MLNFCFDFFKRFFSRNLKQEARVMEKLSGKTDLSNIFFLVLGILLTLLLYFAKVLEEKQEYNETAENFSKEHAINHSLH